MTDKEKLEYIEDDGYKAYMQDKSITSNPYRQGTPERAAWDKGYEEAEEYDR